MERIATQPEMPAFKQVKYTDYNPLKIEVHNDKSIIITLANYRMAVPDGVQRKGVAFYVHGYNTYCEFEACTLKPLADKGYECFALDQRGFGNSGGLRGFFESADVVYSDIEYYIQQVLQHYKIDPKVTPIFLLGLSLGGLISFNLSIRNPDLFKAMILTVPFFHGSDNALYKNQWILKSINFFSPKFNISTKKYQTEEYYQKYAFFYQDPKLITQSRVQSLVMFKTEQDYARENLDKCKIPFLLLTAGQENMVDNKVSIEIMNKTGNRMSKHVEMPHWDHLTMFLEEKDNKEFSNAILEYLEYITNANQ